MKFKSDIEVQAGLKDSSGSNGTSGQVLSSNGTTVSWVPAGSSVASDVQNEVKAGVAIGKGQAVYVTSADGTNIIVGLASNTTEATSSKTLGLLNATVAANGFADVVQIGRLAGLNTSAATVGDPVWLGANGNLIYGLANKPYAPLHLVFIGVVTRVNANNGEIFINVQNGFELNEIHDVDIKTTVPINGDVLGYNGTLWVNKTIAGWLGYTPVTNARTITINGVTQDLTADRSWTVSGGIGGSGTTNRIPKFTASTTIGDSLISEGSGVINVDGSLLAKNASNYNGVIVDNSSSATVGGGYFSVKSFGVGRGLFAVAGAISGSADNNVGIFAEGGVGMGSIKYYVNGSGTASHIMHSNGNMTIGTVTDAGYKLNVNGDILANGFTKSYTGNVNSDNYFEKVFSNAISFPNGSANLAADVRFGNTSFWGYIEVEVTATYSNQNSAGKLTKVFAVGTNTNNLIYTNESRVVDSMGTISDNIAIGDFSWDGTNSTYKIPISHIVSSGNLYTVKVRMFTHGSGAWTAFNAITISNNYSLTALPRQYPYYNDRLGVGTATPAYNFDVNGTGRFQTNLTTPLIGVNATPSSGYPLTVGCTSGASGIKIIGRSDNLGYIEFFNSNGTTVNSSINGSTNGLYITGATAFSSSITAGGNITSGGSMIIPSFETATNVLSFRAGIPDGTNVGIRAKAIATANRDGLEILGYNGIDLTVSNGATVAVRTHGNGNVAVNQTTDAGYKFDVNGTVRSQGNLTVNGNAIFGGSEGSQKRLVSIPLNSADYYHRYILLAKYPTFGNATVNAGFRGSVTMERVNGIGIDVHDDFDFTVSYGNAIAFRQTSFQSYQTSLVQLSYGGTQYLALYAYSAPGWAIAYMDVVQTNYGGWLDANAFVAVESTTPLHSSVSYSSNTTAFKQSVSAPNFTGTLYGTADQSSVVFSNSGPTFNSFFDSQLGLTDKSYLIYNTTDAPRGTLGLYTVSMNKWSGDYGSMFAIDCEPGRGIGYIKSKYGGTWGNWKMLIDASSDQTISGAKTFNNTTSFAPSGGVVGATFVTSSSTPAFVSQMASGLNAGVGARFGGSNGNAYGSTSIEATTSNYGAAIKIITGVYSASQQAIQFTSNTTSVGSITCTTSATAYNTSSDYRLKENVVALESSISRVKALNPCRFNFITEPEKTVDGFIAHEVQEVIPEAVVGKKDELDYDGSPKYQGIDQSKIVPLLTAALKEAISKIEELENRLSTLENK